MTTATTAALGQARVTLGHSALVVRPIGLGCMGMSQFFGPTNDEESVRVIRTALDLGVNFFDTSDIYGAADTAPDAPVRFGHNETVLGAGIKGRRDEAVVATKFATSRDPNADHVEINGDRAYVLKACDASLERLGVDVIDLYYYHRMDRRVPIEETVGAMAELIQAGKVRAIGLSEVSADILRRAHAVHPITALQSEYSLWERGVEEEIVPTCRELGISLIPYAPLGRAALTGAIKPGDTFGTDDFRSDNPRFSAEHLASNLAPVQTLATMAAARGCTPGQLALAWLLAQPHDVVPIPGTKREAYLRENAAATGVAISADEVAHLAQAFSPGKITGNRYKASQAAHVPSAIPATTA